MGDAGNTLDGSRIAAEIREDVSQSVADLADHGITPRLDVILVGEDPASKVYVGSKARTLSALGMISRTHELPEDTEQAELEELVDRLNGDSEVDGILIQLPLPAGLDTAAILSRVDPAKDVDGFHPENVGLLQQGSPRLVPCSSACKMVMLNREGVAIVGMRAMVFGRSVFVVY
ncbi:MAG: tetrahydrofolate dehydrogenase/cyclohydrolase catalytic domain-containing protein, partial [Acidobacteriota bacterium]